MSPASCAEDRPTEIQPRHLTTTRADGDLAVGLPAAVLAVRRASVVDRPWTWLHQVHGSEVVTVTLPGEHAGAEADGAVTVVPGAVLSVTTADCVPVVLLADAAVGVAHAGWRGLLAGVVGATAAAMAELDHPPTRAVIGPSIAPERYEFGRHDLERVASRWGDGVRSLTPSGAPALDVVAGVRAALAEAGVDDVVVDSRCTAADETEFWSHRARAEAGRMATVAWLGERPP